MSKGGQATSLVANIKKGRHETRNTEHYGERDEDDRGRNDRREEARSKTHGRESVSCPLPRPACAVRVARGARRALTRARAAPGDKACGTHDGRPQKESEEDGLRTLAGGPGPGAQRCRRPSTGTGAERAIASACTEPRGAWAQDVGVASVPYLRVCRLTTFPRSPLFSAVHPLSPAAVASLALRRAPKFCIRARTQTLGALRRQRSVSLEGTAFTASIGAASIPTPRCSDLHGHRRHNALAMRPQHRASPGYAP